MPDDSMPIDDLLTAAGLRGATALARGRELLERAGLTRAGKTRMVLTKEPQARQVLAKLVMVCGQPVCQSAAQAADPGAELVLVEAADCVVCGGSDIARAGRAAGEAMATAGVARLLILGGLPVQHRELQTLLCDHCVELRCVDGSRGAHTRGQATANLDWADLVVIWASTPLAHKISQAYTNSAEQRARARQLTVARRSVTAVCEAIVEHLARRRRRC